MIDIVAPNKKEKTTFAPETENKASKKSETKRRPRPKIRGRFFAWLIFVSFCAGAIYYLGTKVLPRLTVNLELKRYAVNFNEAVEINKKFAQPRNSDDGLIVKLPAEFLKENRNLQMSFSATGKQQVKTNARGKIVIYNNFSSDAQSLVAKTRLETPDHKIFRLDKTITVPGAKIQEGKIISSNIEVEATADQPGPEYNIGPVEKFTIPGFYGSSKFAGFYGQSKQPMAGGFVGEAAVPTEKDLESGRAKMKENLYNNLKTFLPANLPPELKVLNGAFDFSLVNEKIIPPAATEKNFQIFSEAQGKLLVFNEKTLKDILAAKSLKQLPEDYGECELLSLDLEYGAPRPDFQNGEMSFLVKGKAEFRKKFDFDFLKEQFCGKNESELKTFIYSLPGVEKARIFFWPFFVKKAPEKIERIEITMS